MSYSRWTAAVLSVVAFSAVAVAQGPDSHCTGPDGLSGPCCTPVPANLPQFPPVTSPALGICWANCAPNTQPNQRVILGTPVPGACGQYKVPLTLLDPVGVPLLVGSISLDYTRTWDETTGGAAPVYQVFRFAAKADLSLPPVPPPAGACPVPPCLLAHPTAFFYGYVDYAVRCPGPALVWEHALVLFHNCDRFIHQPGISDRPGAFHGNRTFAIVSPDTAVNPFVPVVNPPFGGALVSEAVRDVGPVGSVLCFTEERLAGGVRLPIIQGCACPLGFGFGQQAAVRLSGTGSCPDPFGLPSSFTSLNAMPLGLPWLEMITTSIGCWTTGASYPGPECAWVEEGLFQYHDSCATSTAGGGNFVDILYGSATVAGFPVLPSAGGPLTDKFDDLASNLAHDVTLPAVPPFLGSVRPTRHLVYTNVP